MSGSLWISLLTRRQLVTSLSVFNLNGWMITFSKFKLFCACWDSAVWGQSPPLCLVVYSSTCLPPIPPAQSLQCLHFWIQNCTLKLQISNFRLKSAILLLFLSATHPSCTVSPLCCLFCTLSQFIKCPCHCKLALKKVDKKELSFSNLLRDE